MIESVLTILAALLLAWIGVRSYVGWAPGTGSPAPGVTYTSAPSATPTANSSGNVAAATATATLPAVAGKITYIEGIDVTGMGATGAGVALMTVTGLPSTIGTLTFEIAVPAGATVGLGTGGTIGFRFPTPLPASAANTTIVVTLPTLGSGNLNACVTAYGFQS